MSLPRFSVNNSVLVNVLSLVVAGVGCMFALSTTREMFPESRPDKISVSAVYPGVQPDDIEKSVTIRIEEAIRDLSVVEKVESNIRESFTTTIVTLRSGVNSIDAAMQEIKSEIDSIADMPAEVEQLSIRKLEPELPVIAAALAGDGLSEAELKRIGRSIRDDLMRIPGVTDVRLGGSRADEISVEVSPDRLLEFDVTFQEVAAAIRTANLDVSGGEIKGGSASVSIRTIGEDQRGDDLNDIVLKARPDGTKVWLRDVATIRDEFVDIDVEDWFNGRRAMNLFVYKVGDQDAIQISECVKAYVNGRLRNEYDATGYSAAEKQPWYWRPVSYISTWGWRVFLAASGRPDPQAIYLKSLESPFPRNLQVTMHTDIARFIEGRLDLMIRNGQSGLILVFVSLMIFLNWRVALWAAVGIPISFLGTFIVMWMLGVTINLISLFGLVIVLGIIVDDAIVIGENVFRKVEEGMPPRQAAIEGAEEVMWPVIVAVSTTVAAFWPLMFIEGQIGDFFGELPLVVLSALSVSIFEALIVLPSHLAESLVSPKDRAVQKASAWSQKELLETVSQSVDRLLERSGVTAAYYGLLELAIRWRYVTLAAACGSLFIALGLIGGEIVPFVFIQKLDGETVVGAIEMSTGSPAAEVRERMLKLYEASREIEEIRNFQMLVGVQMPIGAAGVSGARVASHVGQMILELLPADERQSRGLRSSDDVIQELRERSEGLPGVGSLTWDVLTGAPEGKDLEIKLVGADYDALLDVAGQIRAKLASYSGVADIDDDLDRGRREVRLELKESARSTGITVGWLGDSVRAALYGQEAKRITRDREDVKIMVRYPLEYRSELHHLEEMWIPCTPTPSADGRRPWAPLANVAYLQEAEANSVINRSQQRRAVKVLADVQEGTSAQGVRDRVAKYFEDEIRPIHPEMEIRFEGAAEEQAKSFRSLSGAMPVSLLVIYLMVAGLFRSYYQPIVIMMSIPFGLQGAVIGHWLTGYPLTILSGIGFVALTGVVVNDAVVLIDYVNQRIRAGVDPYEANLDGAKTRLRAIFLTSETTIAGILPILFETSFQAKFLIPMAVTIAFGLLFSTFQTLMVTPALNMIFFDVLGALGISTLPEEIVESDARHAA